MLEGGMSLEDIQELVRDAFFAALKGKKGAVENLKFSAGLVLLPPRWEDWPSYSKAVVTRERWRDGVAYFRCRFLGTDGLCGIYERRPDTCRSFAPAQTHGCARCASFGVTCQPAVQVCKAEERKAEEIPA